MFNSIQDSLVIKVKITLLNHAHWTIGQDSPMFKKTTKGSKWITGYVCREIWSTIFKESTPQYFRRHCKLRWTNARMNQILQGHVHLKHKLMNFLKKMFLFSLQFTLSTHWSIQRVNNTWLFTWKITITLFSLINSGLKEFFLHRNMK